MRRLHILLIALLAAAVVIACARPADCRTVYVNGYTGIDTQDGSTWSLSRKTIASALDAAVSGDEIWVAGYVYKGCITLKDGVALYGGFHGEETELAQRPPCPPPAGSICETIIDGKSQGSAVTIPSGAGSGTIIDGFTIRNGSAALGGGIHCMIGSSPVIRNNVIKDNLAMSPSEIAAGGGICCECGSAPTIANNTIKGNLAVGRLDPDGVHSGDGGGIALIASAATITGNSIHHNTAVGASAPGIRSGSGGGIVAFGGPSMADISGNEVYGNTANADGGGIWGSQGRVNGNSVHGNTAKGRGGGIMCGGALVMANRIVANKGGEGGGIFCERGTVVSNVLSGNSATIRGGGAVAWYDSSLVNNTIVENSSDGSGEAIYCEATPTLANNLVAFNSGAVSGPCAESGNRYYQNTWGPADSDPKLRAGNVHIQADSYCRDFGDDAFVQTDWTDIDGQPRVQDNHVDVGADESDGTTWDRVVYVKSDGDDSLDGSSWRTAKQHVQAAIDAAAGLQPETCRNEVWVAAGTYHGTVNLKLCSWPAAEIGLYGGFAGAEADMLDRDWRANTTVLDGDQIDSVIVVASGATNTTVIDGFTITNGKGHGTSKNGGGIYLAGAAPTISHNIIKSNGVGGYTSAGGGIYSTGTAMKPLITDNDIRDNVAGTGGGVYSGESRPTIVGNVIAGNVADKTYGGGIACSTQGAIANNLIANNSAVTRGGGVSVGIGGSTPFVNNTIIGNSALTGGGVGLVRMSSMPMMNNIVCFNSTGLYVPSSQRSSNCIYGNGDGDTLAPTEIAVDPLLGENGRITRLSPCVDAGSDADVQPGWTDRDGQARIQGAHVDIGADESDGTRWPVLLYVSPSGDDDNAGRSWAMAKKTLVACYDNAQQGDEIWVRSGTYGTITSWSSSDGILLDEVAYYGGFAGTEVARSERDPRRNVSTQQYGGVLAQAGTTEKAVVDGFTFARGVVYCAEGSPTVSNNSLVRCSSDGCAIYAGHDTVVINNHVCLSPGVGIYCPPGSTPTIVGNRISANSAGGITCANSGGVISGNNITGNSTGSAQSPPSFGGGIYLTGTVSASIVNNTITANGAAKGGGVCMNDCNASAARFANNLVAFNSSGFEVVNSTGLPALASNCAYGNRLGDCIGIADQTGFLSFDPRLASLDFGNGHIQPDSLCRNAGSMAALAHPGLDMDGQVRLLDGTMDIGADESDGTQWDIRPVIRVATTGDDANDGSSWALTKKTIQGAITAASLTGGEVWVAGGTYQERPTLCGHVYLYGGFAGTETSRSERNWHANTTTIDAQRGGCVLGRLTGHDVSRVDGFVLRNGKQDYPSQISVAECIASTATIANNLMIGNEGGSQIYCRDSASLISSNIMVGGATGSTTGIGCSGTSLMPTITANTITRMGGRAIHAVGNLVSTLTVANNILAFNTYGITLGGSVPTDLRNNNVYGNTSANYTGASPGPSDISADPLFVDKANGDYHLSAGSPCIDRGWNGASGMGLFDFDKEGRVCGSAVDIGADEYWPSELPIASVKGAADGAVVHGSGPVVTAAFPGVLYVESPDRACGIRVERAEHVLAVGATTEVSGAVRTNADGERYIDASSVAQVGDGTVGPVALPNSSLGGGPLGLQEGVYGWRLVTEAGGESHRVWGAASGLNNIGLLVRTTGRVVADAATPGSFVIDDGSEVMIKCVLPGGASVDPAWSYVGVTGVCSCERIRVDGRDELRAVVRIRSAEDIAPF